MAHSSMSTSTLCGPSKPNFGTKGADVPRKGKGNRVAKDKDLDEGKEGPFFMSSMRDFCSASVQHGETGEMRRSSVDSDTLTYASNDEEDLDENPTPVMENDETNYFFTFPSASDTKRKQRQKTTLDVPTPVRQVSPPPPTKSSVNLTSISALPSSPNSTILAPASALAVSSLPCMSFEPSQSQSQCKKPKKRVAFSSPEEDEEQRPKDKEMERRAGNRELSSSGSWKWKNCIGSMTFELKLSNGELMRA